MPPARLWTPRLTDCVPQKRFEATKRSEPKAVRVSVPSATLKTPDDVDGYLVELRATLLTHIAAGNPVVL